MRFWLKNTLWVLGFVAACAVAIAVRLTVVHRESGEWRLRPSAEPMLLRFDGHVYDRTGLDLHKEHGYLVHGRDLGGGDILAPADSGAPVSIQVHNLSRFYHYQLAS
ncbi:hypothetical protein P5P86_12690 [Nocardioides sp. BP30]|uniref:hypothetical protein n=1 Tax=Nocardioides sp. BP30 TaxID=3036374 RepID=UPI002468B0D7|nr:hypothetical protein [Nocardioides sp. BP30]WGL50822.1 hypothetical protein P5P86_12690 [Nocardioides sp. BP30]